MGILDWRTRKATAFYALLGVLCSDIWHRGLGKWNLAGLVLMAGLGSLSGIAQIIHGGPPPGDG
jgi:hypothetical protein